VTVTSRWIAKRVYLEWDPRFNHYSMLKTIEDIFGLDYLGYAGAPGLVPFFGCGASDVATQSLGKSGCGN